MYFEKPGRENMEKTIELAVAAAREKGIRHIVVASNKGVTAEALAKAVANTDIAVVCVTHANGFAKKGENELTQEKRKALEAAGLKVLTTTHVLSGAERGISSGSGGMYPIEVMANTLRMFGQGTKVCVEISVMALDAGLIPHGERIVAIGGTGRGADTAMILSPDHASAIFGTRIHQVICRPQ